MIRGSQRIQIRGEEIDLLPEGAIFLPQPRILVIADFHLGKSETFAQHGLTLPALGQVEDLRSLERLIRSTAACEVIFLGDLIHTIAGLTPNLIDAFREAIGTLVHTRLVLGNHDRSLRSRWPASWNEIKISDEWRWESFLFRHEPPAGGELHSEGLFTWAGHVHPCVNLRAGADRLRLKTFVIRPEYGLLPAFSRLAGAYAIEPDLDTVLYPIGDGQVHRLETRK